VIFTYLAVKNGFDLVSSDYIMNVHDDALFFATEILTQFLVFDEKWIDDADNLNIQTLFCHYLTVERVVCIFFIKGILFGWELFPHANVQGLVFLYRVQTPWLGSGQVGSAIYGLG